VNFLRTLGFNRPYLRVGFTDAQNADSYPRDQRFDTVICLNVVEHLPDDGAVVRNIRDALDDGGQAIILVPSGPRLFGTLDQVLGHQRRYTPEQLAALAEKAGFQMEALLRFNRVGVLAWWLNGKLLRRKTFGLWQIRLLNLLTPLFRFLDKWIPLPPLSLIAVLRKPPLQSAPILLASAHPQSAWRGAEG